MSGTIIPISGFTISVMNPSCSTNVNKFLNQMIPENSLQVDSSFRETVASRI